MPTSWRSRLLIGFAALAVAVGLFFAVRAMSSGSQPAEVASATPEASEPSEEPVAQPKPFRVELRSVKGEQVDSSNMFGRKRDSRPKIEKHVAGQVAKMLQRYLNAAFVDRNSRFTQKPLRQILTKGALAALDDRDRRALGAGGPRIVGGTTISARARAVVVYARKRPYAVTLHYNAKMRIIQRDKPEKMRQSGTMVFRRANNGRWAADLVDVTLSLPDPPKPMPPTDPPTAAPSDEGTS